MNQESITKEHYTIAEVCKLLGVSRYRIVRILINAKIRPFHTIKIKNYRGSNLLNVKKLTKLQLNKVNIYLDGVKTKIS